MNGDMTRVVVALQDLVRLSAATQQTLVSTQQTLAAGVAINTTLPITTVAALPATAPTGVLRFASDGRNPTEGAAAGTGCVVVGNGAGVWKAIWSGVAVTA
jgi:hypothetical protein